jgi:uncharacterized membrane protein (DUF106 family)
MEQNNQPLPYIIQDPDKETFRQFTENQGKELEIKLKEVEVAKDNSERHFTFAIKQLEAQERDMRDLREYMLKSSKQRGIYTIVILMVICILLGFCVYMGNAQVVIELVKIVCYGTPAGVGGYYLGRNKTQAENKNSRSSNES